jgi:hypothetical protein
VSSKYCAINAILRTCHNDEQNMCSEGTSGSCFSNAKRTLLFAWRLRVRDGSLASAQWLCEALRQ